MSVLFPGIFTKSLGFQQLTLAGLTVLAVPAGTRYGLLQAIAVDITWRDDGVVPVAGVGFLLPANGEPEGFNGINLRNLHLIGASAGAILNVGYYG